MRKPALGLLAAVAWLALLTACASAPTPAPPPVSAAAPSLEDLGTLPYSSELVADGTAELSQGEYASPAAPGSAAEISIELTDQVAFGDVEGVPSAAVVLVGSAGGSGTFYTLHLVQLVNGTPFEVGYALLGDRVVVEQVEIREGLVEVTLVEHGPQDPMCCPTQRAQRSYARRDDLLVETAKVILEPAP